MSYPNITKVIYDKLIASIVLKGEKMKAFPLRSGIRQGSPLPLFFFNVILNVFVRAVR